MRQQSVTVSDKVFLQLILRLIGNIRGSLELIETAIKERFAGV